MADEGVQRPNSRDIAKEFPLWREAQRQNLVALNVKRKPREGTQDDSASIDWQGGGPCQRGSGLGELIFEAEEPKVPEAVPPLGERMVLGTGGLKWGGHAKLHCSWLGCCWETFYIFAY